MYDNYYIAPPSALTSIADAIREKGGTSSGLVFPNDFVTAIAAIPSGLTTSDALIIATVPTGSTVTATKGGVTLTPTMWVQAENNTLESAIFSIKSSMFDAVNPWTVTATLGTQSASDTIIIDSAFDYRMTLNYALWLYYPGQTSGWTAAAWAAASSQIAKTPTKTYGDSTMTVSISGSGGSTGVVYYDTPVDLTNISSIVLTGNIVGNIVSGYQYNGLYVWDAVTTGYYDTGAVKKKVFTQAGDATLTINVSTITGTKYVGVGIRRSDTNMTIKVNSIELVKA